MNKRILLAGLLGGIALFAWGSFSHLVLKLPAIGIQEIPQSEEDGVKNALRAALPQSGFYVFPAMGAASGSSAEKAAASEAYAQKYQQGPHGILIFSREGAEMMTARQLLIQFALTLVEALIAAWLLSLTTLTGFSSRLGFVVVLGILMALATNIEYWDWYDFPANYTAAYMLDKVIGLFVVGLVIVPLTRQRASAPLLQTTRAA